MRRRSLIAGAAAATMAPRRSRAASGSVLKVVPRSDVTILDPVVTTDYATRNHGLMIWDQLYGLDAQLQPQPQMVAGHVVEDDGRHWTFHLRPGLVFHDGVPVRGRDCVASIRRWAKRDALGQALLARTDEMSAPDDNSFVIRLKRPYGAMLSALAKLGPPALLIMPERLAATDATRQITEFIGSGPFRWKADERVSGARAVYERNPAYVPRPDGVVSGSAGPKRVVFERVEWVVIPDAATAANALTNGEADWWELVPNDLLPLLTPAHGVTTRVDSPQGNLGTGVFNHLHPPFDKAAVRRVVLQAMRQADFMTVVAGTDPTLWRDGVGLFTPGTPMANEAGLEVLGRLADPAAARQALAAAGYQGERVVLMSPSDKVNLRPLADECNDLLQSIGMNVDYQVSDWGTILQRRASKAPPSQGGWNMFNTSWAGLDMIDPAVTQVLRTNGADGFFGWPDMPEITALREAWLDSSDVAEQQKICARMQQVAMQEVPFLPTGQFFYKAALRSDLRDAVEGMFVFWGVRRA